MSFALLAVSSGLATDSTGAGTVTGGLAPKGGLREALFAAHSTVATTPPSVAMTHQARARDAMSSHQTAPSPLYFSV
jgi:hypothetical protein